MNEITNATVPKGLLCPVCRVNLVMSERERVEIDYCPECRGIWLDRGELNKILERSAGGGSPSMNEPVQGHGQYASGHGRGHQGDRHRSFLGRLFD